METSEDGRQWRGYPWHRALERARTRYRRVAQGTQEVKTPIATLGDHLLQSRRMAKSRKRDVPLTRLFYRHVRAYRINQRRTNNVNYYSYGTNRDWDDLPSCHGISCGCARDSRSCLQ